MIAAPPEAATTATPGAVGFGALAKNDAVGISASYSSTSTTPTCRKAAR
jgi:hypothetical protein